MLRKWRKVTLLLSAAMVVLYSVTTLTEIAVIGTQIPRSCCSQFTISASCLVGVAMFVSTYVPFSWCKQMTRQPLSCRECIRNREKECIRKRKKVREPEATFTTRLQLPPLSPSCPALHTIHLLRCYNGMVSYLLCYRCAPQSPASCP